MTSVEAPAPQVRVLLLGPLQVLVDGEPTPPGGPKLRAIVAQLALAQGRVVSVDDLLQGVWGEDLPATARNTLQHHIGVFRKMLAAGGAAGSLITREPGYALQADSDVADFDHHHSQGWIAARDNQHHLAAVEFADALNCWRSLPLADLRDFEFATAPAAALEEKRLACAEAWADAELATGQADSLVPPLQDLVAENPTRERLWEQLMLALYRTGRQDAALSAFRSARAALDRELGVDPSARLRDLHQAILRHDPALTPAGSPSPAASTMLARSRLVTQTRALHGPGGRFELVAPVVVIGRSLECDLTLADDQASRRHAEIRLGVNGPELIDLGSTNGTRINGAPLGDVHVLRDGDQIGIGYTLLRYSSGA